jgi:hypothetical protein
MSGDPSSKTTTGIGQQVIDVLRGLSYGQVVLWHDPLVYENEMLHGGVDVFAPLVCDPIRIAWAWTINCEPDDDDGILDLAVAPDEIIEGQPAWNIQTVNAVLWRWTAEHAERTDLRFTINTDLTSPMEAALLQTIRDESAGCDP